MTHGPAPVWKEDGSTPFKTRFGFWMFTLYSLVYAGFILINVTTPKLMDADIGSFNLAIIYGFGLIVFALILAVIYNDMSNLAEKRLGDSTTEGGSDQP